MKAQIFLDGNKRAAVTFANHYLITHGGGFIVIPEKEVACGALWRRGRANNLGIPKRAVLEKNAITRNKKGVEFFASHSHF